jgi:hypothetical protein
MMDKTLVKYLRKKNGTPYGVLVAVKRPDGEVCVDFSLCNIKKDRFTKQRALEIAYGRALNSKQSNRTIPSSISKDIDLFNKRVEKYYRKNIVE